MKKDSGFGYPRSLNALRCFNEAASKQPIKERHEAIVENMDQYDVAFLGFPNWWGTLPPALNCWTGWR